MNRLLSVAVMIVAILLPRVGSAEDYTPTCPEAKDRTVLIAPVPKPAKVETAVVQLGRLLFHEPKMSRDGTIACASCHSLPDGGDDGRVSSIGIDGQQGPINAPSVLNRAFDFKLFWDGRAENLLDQVDGPLGNPAEMDSSWPIAIYNLRGDAEFERAFAAAYPGQEPSAPLLRQAIAEYESQLVTPGSPFDRFLCGDDDALDEDARKGFDRFVSLGCASCHQGQNVGGNLFQRFGVFDSLFSEEGVVPAEGKRAPTEADLGRFNVTHKPEDRYVFKVPSLRNVEQTAPYFHDGSAETLEDAVRVMARVQLGRTLSDVDVRLLTGFLRSLTGEIDPRLMP